MRALAILCLMAMHGKPIDVAGGEDAAWIAIFRDAASKGLDPQDYSATDLTTSVLRYLSDLSSGRANPRLYDHPGENPEALLRQIAAAPDFVAALARIEPPFEGYRRTLMALEQYRKLAFEDDGELLPAVRKLQPGEAYAGVPRLTRLLREWGDLPPDATAPDAYSGPLVDAVKHFQTRHGLDADGIIGPATLAQLNTPLSHRIRQLELTLERWRWVPHNFPRPPIVVNIPEFEVRALDDSLRTGLEMKVVVGKAYRLQTPLFSAQLEQVIFRPYWNVPRKIQRNELVPEIERDRPYLIQHEYEAVTPRGQVVTAGEVSDEVLALLRSGALLLRQRPGPNNALGLVKFVFPNPNDVYMHDTPSVALFGKSRRDFSHGCIRLEHAAELAEWVLRDEGWSKERIRAAMQGSETVRVNLKRPIPVLIVYGTAVVLDNGEVRFFEDIYKQDAALEEQLQLTTAARGPHPRG